MSQFVEQLRKTIDDYTEPFMDEKACYDKARLKPGYAYNEELAEAICHSACMVVVYVPKYERHDYCVREFHAMEMIEQKRKTAVGAGVLGNRRMIIPIILRADLEKGLPGLIKNFIQYCDFTKYTTAKPDFRRNSGYVQKVDEVAHTIYEIYDRLQQPDPCTECNQFRLPPAPLIQGLPLQPFPRPTP